MLIYIGKKQIGFVRISEIGKEGDLIGRTKEGKCAVVKERPEEMEIGQIWLGMLDLMPKGTAYFFKPLTRYF